MAISMYQIKRWYRMLSGKSIDHVNQDLGKCFSTTEIKGYYNNLTEKVTKNPRLLNTAELPTHRLENGNLVYFPVAIFQYGLGAYDLYLVTEDEKYLKKFLQCANWALENIDSQGRWNNFFFYCPDTPYSAMAQGEGTSLLVRAYIYTGDNKYLDMAQKAINFMLLSIENGGTVKYENGKAFLMEYTFKGMVLNGAIFAWWGLFDYVSITHDTESYKNALGLTLNSIIEILPKFKYPYWSMYSLDGLIASPFYHNLHIAQMQAMYDLTGMHVFKDYSILWRKQQKNLLCSTLAFCRKVIQKLLER